MGALHVVISASAAERLDAARAALASCAAASRVLLVGASRGAADDLARDAALRSAATFGIRRLSLTQLAARAAMLDLAAAGAAPSTWLGAEAVAARAVFDVAGEGRLGYFAPVAATPGFPRAVARTLQELRLTAVDAARLATVPPGGPGLARLLDRFEALFEEAGTADRATLFRAAERALRRVPAGDVVVLLDLPLDHPADRGVIAALVSGASRTTATVPHGERAVAEYYATLGATVEEREPSDRGDLACLRRYLFAADRAAEQRQLDGSLEFFSAPGEGRESVEIARRLRGEAARGVAFDQMAIFIRSPHSYFGLLEHALRRADIPAWFDRGTRRPHPTGRAFLALLACAAERLSAERFAEYLSLGQVPVLDAPAADVGASWAPSHDDALNRTTTEGADEEESEQGALDAEVPDAAANVVAGTLRAPWKWEKLLVEAAVIGGAARWVRRLDGKQREIGRQIEEARREDGDGGRIRGLEQVAQQLEHLRSFALPLVERLAAWPVRATWGEWLDRFEELAPLVLRFPAHVQRVLADLRPMAAVGPIDLDEARRVLADRLLTLEAPPPSRRYGRVFVGTPEQARGRSFRVVFVPGLAERMFPQKPREDPLLLDEPRSSLEPLLTVQRRRLSEERLLLQLAAGAAAERLYVSYPRIELSEARARVPSFYALDVMRAATGRVPDHEALEERARRAGNATLAWPAPPRADEAIDDQEHDLAVLRRLLDEPDRESVKGHAHYLLKLNESLRRSVRDRWARGERRWSPADGLTNRTPHVAPALAAQRLSARAFSLSVLQKFSACPYQFLLAAVYRLHPLERPEPLQRLDPLARGSLFHTIQAAFFNALRAAGSLPVTTAGLPAAREVLHRTIEQVASREHEALAPAVERVWNDEVAAIRRDLDAWLDHLARDGEEWEPKHFEFGFGTVPGERDPASVPGDVTLDGGYRLRGAIDLIEEHRVTKVLRITDHKTGRKPERIERVIVDGGAVLQPVLYGMAVEAALGRRVSHGRLFYCTSGGGFYAHSIPLDERTRAAGLEVLRVIDRAIESGFLVAAPTEDACARCDFRRVCGPGVSRRTRRKPQEAIADLLEIRRRP